MNAFKDFNIKPTIKSFVGDKIKMSKILNKPVKVLAFKEDVSKYPEKGNGKCLHLQIDIAGSLHIVFTGSTVLMNMIKQVPSEKFPFDTIIIEENESYQFT